MPSFLTVWKFVITLQFEFKSFKVIPGMFVIPDKSAGLLSAAGTPYMQDEHSVSLDMCILYFHNKKMQKLHTLAHALLAPPALEH